MSEKLKELAFSDWVGKKLFLKYYFCDDLSVIMAFFLLSVLRHTRALTYKNLALVFSSNVEECYWLTEEVRFEKRFENKSQNPVEKSIESKELHRH